MKMTKKIMSLAIVFAMVMAMSVSVFAAGETTGSITVKNAIENETYSIYKVFDATFVDEKTVSYKFTKTGTDANNALFTALEDVFTMTASATNANVYNVALKDGKGIDDIITVLKANIANMTKAADDIKATGETVVFNNLPFGYYFIDSTTGSLVTIDSNLPNAEVEEKNALPSLAKTVMEDSTEKYGEYATADYGQVVDFKLTVTIGKGNDKAYTINDVLPAGMTYVSYTEQAGLTATPAEGNKSVQFVIDAAKIQELNKSGSEKFVIDYKAVVDGGVTVNSEMKNVATLTYSEQTFTANASVYTHSVPVFKYTGTEKTPLANATFALYKMEGETKMYYVLDADNNVTWTADLNAATKYTSGNDGMLVFDGVDAGNYFLEETVAPDGYNLLTAPKDVTVVDKTGAAQTDVENKTGTELPSTGGIGTTIFYALGGLMAVGAGVLLVAKKRMEA